MFVTWNENKVLFLILKAKLINTFKWFKGNYKPVYDKCVAASFIRHACSLIDILISLAEYV